MRILGKTGLHVSGVGFGTYRIHEAVSEHADALHLALSSGINLIDTSSNYTNGGSERLVGQILKSFNRQEIVVVGKGGYLQGQLYHESKGYNFSELIQDETDLAYCIHPDSLEFQLTQSLNRLETPYLDVYLIHNPEYYLISSEKKAVSHYQADKEYYRRLEAAFSYLEKEVSRGRIKWYGVSSNTFSHSSESFTYTSLEKILKIAGPHFAVVQCPFNLLERGAILEENSSHHHSVLQLARQNNIGTLINRPLNAIKQGVVVRLTDIGIQLEGAQLEDVVQSFSEFSEFEKQIFPGLASFSLSTEEENKIQNLLSFTHELKESWMNFTGYVHWREALQAHILPRLEEVVEIVSSAPNFEHHGWFMDYIHSLHKLLKLISSFYQQFTLNYVQSLKVKIKQQVPEWSLEQLQHTAIRALRETESVSSVLVGMRKPSYVKNILQEYAISIPQRDTLNDWMRLDQVLPS